MNIYVFLSLISIFVAAEGYTVPNNIKLNNLDVRPLNSKPYIDTGRHVKSRIVGGKDVNYDAQHLFGHQVRIIAESKTTPTELYGCGASIITDEWVITAAHCLDIYGRITLFLGMLDTRDGEFMEQRNATEANWFLHPKWSRKTFHNDIALIKLIPKLNMNTDEIHLIRLPHRTKNCTQYFGTPVTISGWGITSDTINYNTILKYAAVKVVTTKEDCTKTWGQFIDFNTMICVDSSRKRGSCGGDSGGPLVYTQQNGLQILIGITSFGTSIGCETVDPRVYTCVNGFRDWIYGVTQDEFLKD